MAEAAEQLVVALEARIRDFEKNMARAQRSANDNFTGIERRARRAGRNLEQSMSTSTNAMTRSLDKFGTFASGKLKGAFAAIAAGVSLNELRKVADQYTGIMNSLKVAGVGDAQLSGVFDRLFASAQKNAVPLDALAQLYSRVSQAQTTLKASSSDILRVTDIVAQSLRVSGKSASESSGALLQLSQAFSNGKVQAEEYNSLLDGAYPLLQAAAAGMKEAGGDVAKLTSLVKDGKVSSEAFFRAIEAGAPILEEKLAGAALTSEQAWQKLQNELIAAVGEFDKATGASAALASGIDTLAGSIAGIGSAATSAVTGVQTLIGKIGELYAANGAVLRQQGLIQSSERAALRNQARDMGTANAGGRDALANERAAAERAAKDAARTSFRASENAFAAEQAAAAKAKAVPTSTATARVNPISLANYKVPGEEGKASGSGGGGGSSAEKLSRYEREIQAIQRRTEALQQEATTVGKGTLEVERSKIALQLEQAAKRENITITAEMRTAIDAAATGYANAKVKIEDLKASLEGVRDAQKFFATEITDGLTDMILEGKSATDVIQGLAKALLKAAMQAALMGSGPLAGLFGTAGKDGAVGGLFGMLAKGVFGFAEGGFTGPGAKHQPAGIVHRGEVVWSQSDIRRAGGVATVEAMRRGIPGYSDGGFVGTAPAIRRPNLPAANSNATPVQQISISAPITVNGSAGTPEQNDDLAKRMAKEMETSVRSVIADEMRKQSRPGNFGNTRTR